jgi:arylsulfatase A-like enzyme
MAFIEAHQSQPFFLYYAVVQPHAEMLVPEEAMERFRGRFPPESSYQGTDHGPDFRKFAYGSQPEAHAAFAAMVTCIDDYVGEITAKLEELGIADDTLILFTSDNGPHQEGGHDPDYFRSNGPLRGYKRDLYEGGIRVPTVVSWPGKVKPGARSAHPSAFWDVMPTVAEVAGIPCPEGVDGISFLPTLLGRDDQRAHDFLYWEFHELGGRQAIRKGRWKAIRHGVAQDPDAPLELYDLSIDPGETRDLAAENPQVCAELDELMRSARTKSPVADFNFPLERQAARAARAHEH